MCFSEQLKYEISKQSFPVFLLFIGFLSLTLVILGLTDFKSTKKMPGSVVTDIAPLVVKVPKEIVVMESNVGDDRYVEKGEILLIGEAEGAIEDKLWILTAGNSGFAVNSRSNEVGQVLKQDESLLTIFPVSIETKIQFILSIEESIEMKIGDKVRVLFSSENSNTKVSTNASVVTKTMISGPDSTLLDLVAVTVTVNDVTLNEGFVPFGKTVEVYWITEESSLLSYIVSSVEKSLSEIWVQNAG